MNTNRTRLLREARKTLGYKGSKRRSVETKTTRDIHPVNRFNTISHSVTSVGQSNKAWATPNWEDSDDIFSLEDAPKANWED